MWIYNMLCSQISEQMLLVLLFFFLFISAHHAIVPLTFLYREETQELFFILHL